MATETILLETGDHESLAKTIRAFIERNWGDGSDTGDKVPKFKSPDGPDKTQAARDRKSTRLNSSHIQKSRMPSSA